MYASSYKFFLFVIFLTHNRFIFHLLEDDGEVQTASIVTFLKSAVPRTIYSKLSSKGSSNKIRLVLEACLYIESHCQPPKQVIM